MCNSYIAPTWQWYSVCKIYSLLWIYASDIVFNMTNRFQLIENAADVKLVQPVDEMFRFVVTLY